MAGDVQEVPSFHVGDRVYVHSSADEARRMQEGHGGWNPKMEEVNI